MYNNPGCPPVFYDYSNAVNGMVSPSTTHASTTGLSQFFQRYLLQKAFSVFKWNLPKSWNKDYFLYVLYCCGYLAVLNTDRFGVIPQQCGLSGYGVFYQPTNAIISNPLFHTRELIIERQCSIFKLQANYSGIMDIVTFYGDMMALCAEGAAVNILNSKLAYVFFANDKAAAESFKKLLDKVTSGEAGVVIDKRLQNADGSKAWESFVQNVGQNYIAGDLLDDLRKWEQKFLKEIGVPTANTEKKERLTTDEVNISSTETEVMCASWLERLKECAEKCNAMFTGVPGYTNISVDWRIKPEREVEQDGTRNTGPAGTV